MNKDIVSVDYIWDDILLGWKDAKNAFASFKSSKGALLEAKTLLNSHSDVSSLNLGTLSWNINCLLDDTEDFISLASKMHDDLEYDVDRPFYKHVMETVANIYAENPSDVSYENPSGSLIDNTISLEDLFSSVRGFIDEDLRSQLFDGFESLDEDEPSTEIQELILESISEYYDGVYTDFMLDSGATLDEFKASREIFIQYYEMAYPERGDKLDDLFDEMADDTTRDYQEDIDNIKFISYTADETFQTVFFEFIDRMEIADYSASGQSWNHVDNVLNLNFDSTDRKGLADPRGPYTVFFHEIGHGIDDLCRSEKEYFLWVFKTSDDLRIVNEYRADGLSLNDVTSLDVQNRLIETTQSMADLAGISLTEAECNIIVDELIDPNSGIDILNSDGSKNKELSNIYNDVIGQIQTELSGNKIGGISDVYGGVTVNVFTDPTLNSHHEASYWYDGGEYKKPPSIELFAHYFAYNMTGSEEQMGYLEEYLPNANEMMDDMIELVEKEIIGD